MERFSKNLPIERMHAAARTASIVGGAGAFPFELTVPGAVVPTAGVTVVGTFPTHRRRGVLRSMMRAQLDDVHARGEPLALLWASEDTIYGRFGYGMASQCAEVSISEGALGLRAPARARGDVAASSTPTRRSRSSRASGTRCAGRRRGCSRALATGGSSASSSSRPAAVPRAGPSGSSSSSATGGPRGTRSTGTSRSGTNGVSGLRAPGRRGGRARRSSDGRALAVPPRHRLGGADHRLAASGRSPALVAPRARRDGCDRDSATGSGCGSSTSRPRCPRAVTQRTAQSCSTSSTSSVRGTPARWRVARRPGEAHDRSCSASLRRELCSARRTSEASRSRSSFEAGRVEELRRGAAARADAMFATERAPWCPEIF